MDLKFVASAPANAVEKTSESKPCVNKRDLQGKITVAANGTNLHVNQAAPSSLNEHRYQSPELSFSLRRDVQSFPKPSWHVPHQARGLSVPKDLGGRIHKP